MRYLILTRGITASGKTTFLKSKKMEAYTLSAESINLEFEGPILDLQGKLVIPSSHSEQANEVLRIHLKARMKLGELIFIDRCHISTEDLLSYNQLALQYRYKVFCLNFADVDINECKLRNKDRETYKIVSDEIIDQMHLKLKSESIPNNITILKPEDLDGLLDYKIPDYSNFNKIHHFGDIQGCLKPLKKYFELYPIQENELYIFVGDYCDRGNENGETLDFLLNNYKRTNFILLEGNHEEHLWDWATGQESRLDEFKYNTKPQLEDAKIDPKKVQEFILSLKSLALYSFDEKKVLATHGGMSTIPTQPVLIKNNQFIRGVGNYEDCTIIDHSFYKNTNPNEYQIHGHRNIDRFAGKINSRCFNLEGKVEFGGNLRVVQLSHSKGFELIEIHNPL